MAMPDGCEAPEQAVADGSANRRTPSQTPDGLPHRPGLAEAGSSVAIVSDQPSVHQGWPWGPTAIRWGVPLIGRTIWYSAIGFRCLRGLRTAMRSTALLFSVNQMSLR